MAAELWINRNSGDIRIGDLVLLQPNQSKSSIVPLVADLLVGSSDHRKGFEWLSLAGVTFGGQPARISICFHDGRLKQALWSVELPDAPSQGGWPTREAIDAEIAFVRRTLENEMGIGVGSQSWGKVWSSFDQKGFLASNGLRYTSS